MTKTKLFFVLLLGFFLLPDMGHAETRYIGDTLIVAIHSGPGKSFPKVKTLRTGARFTVLNEQDGYLQIQTADDIEGWLQKQYTMANPPSAAIVPKLRAKLNRLILSNKHSSKEIAELKKQLTQENEDFQNKQQEILAQNKADQAELEGLRQALEQKKSQYQELVDQSKQFFSIRDERDKLKKSQTAMESRMARLESENRGMAGRQMIYWFLAGGGVLLIGWLIGRTSLKKNRSSLSL